jgi:hypothetical protein
VAHGNQLHALVARQIGVQSTLHCLVHRPLTGRVETMERWEAPTMAPKQPNLTLGDRLIAALLAGVFGFLTMSLIWFLVLNFGAHSGEDISLPFSWTWIVSGMAAVLGFAVGPERMVDGFSGVWHALGRLMFWRVQDQPLPKSRKHKSR